MYFCVICGNNKTAPFFLHQHLIFSIVIYVCIQYENIFCILNSMCCNQVCMSRFIISILLFLVWVFPSEAQIVINELQASNGSTLFDEDGDAEDWIELFNTGSDTVNLSGYGLSDDYDNPFRWIIPDVTIQPGEFLLVWASGKDRTLPSAPMHTNFSISSSGEEVLLTAPNGERMDEIAPVPIPRDISYGRYPDGSENFYFFSEPTPGSQNSSERYRKLLEPPVFSHQGGQYTSSFQLTLSADEDASIYYTTDGTMPTDSNGFLYNGPITISGSRMVRARTFAEDALESKVKTHIYNEISPQLAGFNSNLPLVIINHYKNPVNPGPRVPGAITFIDKQEDGRSVISNENMLQSRMVINKRGSSSLMFPKNMFGFHLRDEDDTNRNESLLGLPAEHNWILYAPYTDFTFMRNVVAYQLFEDQGWYSPRTRFVELFMHSGNGPVTQTHYHGIYVLVERIKWDQNRVNITKITPGDNSEPEITGGYIIKKYRLNPGESGFRTRSGTRLAHVRPAESDITREQQDWIRNYVSDFEDVLYGSNFSDPVTGYEAFIDVDSFIDHFLHTELLKEIDGYRLSTFMHKDRNGKLVMGPVWDYNLSIGIANYLGGWQPQGWYYLEASNDCFVGCGIRDWYLRLMEDQNYLQRMYNRWWELRRSVFSNQHLLSLIDDNKELLMESQVRDFQRWPRLGTYVWPNWYIGNSFDDEVSWMRNWLIQRIAWMDRQMGEPTTETGPVLKYFWYFSDDLPNNTPLQLIESTYHMRNPATIEFQSALEGYPFNEDHPEWRQASMERRNRPTSINYRHKANKGKEYTEDEMRALQIRQPFRNGNRENTLIFHLPTTGYEDVTFSFAAMDEGAASRLIIDYSVSNETPQWISTGLANSNPELTDAYSLFEFIFTDIEQANNNPDFKIRIWFDGEQMTARDGNRVTFNNISFESAGAILPTRPGETPVRIRLDQNYPNPFNTGTVIRFSLPTSNVIRLDIYDILGRRVATLAEGLRESGTHEVQFDASNLSSGIYLYRLSTPFEVITKKMALVK